MVENAQPSHALIVQSTKTLYVLIIGIDFNTKKCYNTMSKNHNCVDYSFQSVGGFKP